MPARAKARRNPLGTRPENADPPPVPASTEARRKRPIAQSTSLAKSRKGRNIIEDSDKDSEEPLSFCTSKSSSGDYRDSGVKEPLQVTEKKSSPLHSRTKAPAHTVPARPTAHRNPQAERPTASGRRLGKVDAPQVPALPDAPRKRKAEHPTTPGTRLERADPPPTVAKAQRKETAARSAALGKRGSVFGFSDDDPEIPLGSCAGKSSSGDYGGSGVEEPLQVTAAPLHTRPPAPAAKSCPPPPFSSAPSRPGGYFAKRANRGHQTYGKHAAKKW